MSERTGTREWAEHSVNVCLGCSHGCLYCYAADMASRFARRGRDAWDGVEQVNWAKVDELKGKRFKGRVMFPTTHDWTAGSSEACAAALAHLLEAGNDVLVVTKGGARVALEVAKTAVKHITVEGVNPEMRFSITCVDSRVARFWEPGAPEPFARLAGLRRACELGLPTSVSIEPMLEPHRAVELVDTVDVYCQSSCLGRGGEIWIGKANQLARRTAWARGRVDGIEGAVRQLEAGQTDDQVMRVYEQLRGHTKVRWKDSYAEVIRRCGEAEADIKEQR
jgi:pyruvate-formate lyase-activating enzyme